MLAESPVSVDEDELRRWATAERIAVMAEEFVRGAMQRHLAHGEPPPSDDAMRAAQERRGEADALFRKLRTASKDEGAA